MLNLHAGVTIYQTKYNYILCLCITKGNIMYLKLTAKPIIIFIVSYNTTSLNKLLTQTMCV